MLIAFKAPPNDLGVVPTTIVNMDNVAVLMPWHRGPGPVGATPDQDTLGTIECRMSSGHSQRITGISYGAWLAALEDLSQAFRAPGMAALVVSNEDAKPKRAAAGQPDPEKTADQAELEALRTKATTLGLDFSPRSNRAALTRLIERKLKANAESAKQPVPA